VAVVEEFVFRWFFAKRFRKLFNFETGIILSSILFGFIHIPTGVFNQHLNIAEMGGYIFSTFLFGVMLGYFYLKTNSFMGIVLWHGLWNSIGANLGFRTIGANFISWQSELIMSLLLIIVIFFIVMSIMVFILKDRKKTNPLPAQSLEGQDSMENITLDQEITPYSYTRFSN
jgi:membrane protease YdiL (CAAX protease family)